MAIEPDTKNWTWVLERPCPDCGFDASAVDRTAIGDAVRANAATWATVLARPDAASRTDPDRWSVLEYACHVRDVFRIFDGRVGAMVDEDGPAFANWDQDQTAIDDDYAGQDPATVAAELTEAAAVIAARFDTVDGATWDRTGLRSDGSAFTIDSLGRYFLHDPVHHLWDVGALD